MTLYETLFQYLTNSDNVSDTVWHCNYLILSDIIYNMGDFCKLSGTDRHHHGLSGIKIAVCYNFPKNEDFLTISDIIWHI